MYWHYPSPVDTFFVLKGLCEFNALLAPHYDLDDMQAMDLLLREFFSNFPIKSIGTGNQRRYEIDYKLKEPYQGFLENNKFVRGRDGSTGIITF